MSEAAGLIEVVDDCDVMRQLARKILERAGFEVVEASSARDGLRLAAESKPDLILSDIMMPECDGFGMVESIRKNEALRDVPVVFMSGFYLDPEVSTRSSALGVREVVSKPLIGEVLVEAVRKELGRR